MNVFLCTQKSPPDKHFEDQNEKIFNRKKNIFPCPKIVLEFLKNYQIKSQKRIKFLVI